MWQESGLKNSVDKWLGIILVGNNKNFMARRVRNRLDGLALTALGQSKTCWKESPSPNSGGSHNPTGAIIVKQRVADFFRRATD
jgi:hypothetical protein